MSTQQIIRPRAVPVEKSIDVQFYEDYAQLCDTLQRKVPVELEKARFETLLLEMNQAIYNFDDVAQYLKMICPSSKEVIWAPLAKIDWEVVKPLLRCTCRFNDLDVCRQSIFSSPITFGKQPYHRLIPVEVLTRLARIRQEIPATTAPFFVSDYAVPHPDPFVMTFFGHDAIVFDAWDEPGFGVGLL